MSNSTVGTPYTSIRYGTNAKIAIDKTPERAVEQSLGAGFSLPRESPSLDQKRATDFEPSKESEAEDRIGV